MTSPEALVLLHERFEAQLEELARSVCKEARTELHARHEEIASWLLLYEGSDLADVHAAFVDVVAPLVGQAGTYQFTVGYYRFEDRRLIALDFLSSTEEVLRGWSVGPLGSQPVATRASSVFDATDSKRITSRS